MSQPILRGLGVCAHLPRRHLGWYAEELVPIIRAMGAGSVRSSVGWSQTETERGNFAVRESDIDWIRRCNDAGLSVQLILAYGNPIYDNPLDPDAFSRYAGYIARTFKDYDIAGYEVWNEPTNFAFRKQYGGSWSGYDPCLWREKFAELLAKAAHAVKDADPDAFVTQNIGEPQFYFLAKHHPASLADVDGQAIHPYPTRFPPETVPWGGEQIHERDRVTVAAKDHSYVSVFEHTRRLSRETLGRELRVDVTEYGFSTYNPWKKPSAMSGYTEPVQAAYLVRGILLTLVARVERIYLYNIMDDGVDWFEQEDNFGMIAHSEAGYRRKQSYGAIQRLAGLLGEEHEVLTNAPATLVCEPKPLPVNNDQWQQPVIEPHPCINTPQLHCFRTPQRHVAFVWRAGRMDGEYNAPLGDLLIDGVPSAVDVLDIVNDRSLTPTIQAEDGRLRVRDLPVGGNPIAVCWQRAP